MAEKLPQDVLVALSTFMDQLHPPGDYSVTLVDGNTHMKLYTAIFNYLTKKSIGPDTRTKSRLVNHTDDEIVGADLYDYIPVCLEERVKKIYEDIKTMTTEDIFQNYQICYDHFKTQCSILEAAFHYLHRHWIRRERHNGRRNVLTIKELAEQIWHKTFFQPLFPDMQKACLDLIKIARIDHSVIPIQSIKNTFQLFRDKNFLNLLKTDPKFESINDIYIDCLELNFLQDFDKFYCQEKQNFPSFEEHQMLEYLTSIATYFEIEINVIQACFPENQSTSKILIDKLDELFLPDEIFAIISTKIQSLVQNQNDFQELIKFYKLFRLIPKIKNQFIIYLKNRLAEMAKNVIERINKTTTDDSKIYIETIIDIYQTDFKSMRNLFYGEKNLLVIVDEVCAKFINHTKESVKLLIEYCDRLLRNKNQEVNETDLEKKINEIMIVFDYIEDKDKFEKLYRNRLVKRLVGQLSTSEDHEKLLISKLNQICGDVYTSKLEQLLRDIDVSRDLIVEYEKYCAKYQILDHSDFSVMVFTSNSYPFSGSSNLILPIELKPTFDSFTEFYTNRHSGRKLTWLYQHSKGELQTYFTPTKYILQVSTYQMTILLLFNKVLTWSVEQIQDKTQIDLELLQQILVGLLKSKLLLCTNIHEDELNEDFKHTDIETHYSLELATDFKSKQLRMNLNIPLKSMVQKDIENIDSITDGHRKMIMQAAIARIMKGRRILKYALLIQEVIEQLKPHFKPKIPDIKKCIDILIEKEYLERDANDKDVLHYLT